MLVNRGSLGRGGGAGVAKKPDLPNVLAQEPRSETSLTDTQPHPPRPGFKKSSHLTDLLTLLWGGFVCEPDSNNCSNIYRLCGYEQKVLRN